jgi:iron(III) transport system substrate-binding protein
VERNLLHGAAVVVLLRLGAVVPDAAAEKRTRTVAEVATYESADRQALLLDGANSEGELSIYYTHPVIHAIATAFERKHGIKVKLWRASSEAVIRRVIAEYRAGQNQVDVFLSTAADTEAASREKLLQEVRSPVQQELIEMALPTNRQWTAFHLDIYTAAYNTHLLKEEELPKTYEDLLDPKWKGRLAVEANDHPWFGSLLSEMGEERGRKLFEQIIAVNGLSVRKGHSLLAGLVASGEVPLALTVYSWNPEQLKRKGAPIEPLFIPPLIANAAAIGLINKAPHPNAAILFYDFLFTEGQKLMAEIGYVPTSKKVDSPARRLPVKLVDPGHALEMQDKWLKLYDDTIVKKAK